MVQVNKRKHKEADADADAGGDVRIDVEEYRAAIESFSREPSDNLPKAASRPGVSCLTDLFAGIM